MVPIDIRLTKRGDPGTSNGGAIALTHGGDTTVTKKADLTVPGGALASGRKISLTAVGAQALTGLLPLGWSPIASAEVTVDGSDTSVALSGSQLTFTISAAEVSAAAQNLTAVSYDATRDEWRVLVAVGNVGADGKVAVPIGGSGAYALVYPDKVAVRHGERAITYREFESRCRRFASALCRRASGISENLPGRLIQGQ